MNDNIKNLWNTLRSRGFNPPELNQFAQDMQNEENLKKVHKTLRDEGFTPPEFGAFKVDILGKQNTAAEQPASAAQPVAANAMMSQSPITGQQARKLTPPAEVKRGDGSMLMGAQPILQRGGLKPNIPHFKSVPMLKTDEVGEPEATTDKFNYVTGEYEGDDKFYTDWQGNKIPVESNEGKLGVEYAHHLKDVISPINKELEEARKEGERIEKLLSERHRQIDAREESSSTGAQLLQEAGRVYAGDKLGGYSTGTELDLKYNSDQEYQQLMSAARKNRALIRTLENKRDGKMNDFWNSFGQTLTDGYTFSMGAGTLYDAASVADAMNYLPEIERKQKAGKALTHDEDVALTVLKNHAWDNEVQQRYGDEYGAWSRAAQTAAGSIELGVDFLTMGPVLKATAGGVMKLTEKGVEKMLGNMITKGLGKYMTKATGATLGSMAAGAVMSNTSGAGRLWGDFAQRMQGDVVKDEENDSYKLVGGKPFLQAAYEAEMAATIENGSEVLGDMLPGSGIILKGLEKIGLKRVAGGLTSLSGKTWYKNYTKALEAVGFHGIGGEAIEEYTSLFGNALLVGDNKFSDFIDPKTHIDIWLGCAATGGLLNAPRSVGIVGGWANSGYQAAQYYRYKHKTDKADAAANAVWGNEWAELRDVIDNTRNEDMTDLATSIYEDVEMPLDKKAAMLNYIGNLTAMRGYNMGRISMEREDKNGRGTTQHERDVNLSYAQGHNAEDGQKNDYKNLYEYQRQQATEKLGEDVVAQLDADPIGALTGIVDPHSIVKAGYEFDEEGERKVVLQELEDGRLVIANANEEHPTHVSIVDRTKLTDKIPDSPFDAEQKKLARDYVNAKATYDGVIDRVRDDIDTQSAASDAAVDRRVNKQSGMIQGGILSQGKRRVYVIDGDVVLDEEGRIDAASSSESMLVLDPNVGEPEWVSPMDFESFDAPVDPNEEKDAARVAIGEEIAETQANIIDGTVSSTPGTALSIMDEQGATHQAEIVQDNGDGTVLASIDGGEAAPVPLEVLQEMSDRESLARMEQFLQEQAVMDAEEATDADASGTMAYNFGDEIVLRGDNGEAVRAYITTEENEDGQIEVYMDKPINGKKVYMLTRQQLDDMLFTPDANATGTVAAGETNADATGTVADEAVEPMPMIGEGEDAEPDFGATTSKRGHDYIFNESGLEESDATAIMENNLAAANKELEKVSGKRPKPGTSIPKFNKDMAAWNARMKEAQEKARYWKEVKAEREKVLAKRLDEQSERERIAIEQAQQAEAAYRAEQEAKAAEQAQLGTNTVAPAIRDKWNAAPKEVGMHDEIVLPNGEKITGRYYLVESGAASASHNSTNGFTKTEGFPVDENGGSVNDRDYERDKEAQQVTRTIADNYDSRAVQTPVVVSQDGVVLSGNGRTMAGELAAAQGTDGSYNEYAASHAGRWGFTPEQVQKKQHPRVVFVPDEQMPYTAETFAKFNQQEMKSQSKTEQAVKLGKVVSDDAFNRIIRGINQFDTLGDFYADPKAAAEAIAELQREGVLTQAQMAEMFDGDGISAVGKELLENMLIGKAFESNPDAVREISEFKSMRQSIITALAEISNNLALGEYSLEQELAQAIDLVYQARKNGSKHGEAVSWFARQQNLDFFGMQDTVADYTNATMLMIADVINDSRSSRLKKYLQIYNTNAQDAANGQMDLFSGDVKTKEDIINEVKQLFNYGTEEEQQAAAQAAVERRKADSVQQDGVVGDGDGADTTDERRGRETDGRAGERQSDLGEKVEVRDNPYGYSNEDFEEEKTLNERYAKKLEELSAIENDDEFEEKANEFDRSVLPDGFTTVVDESGKLHIVLAEPAIYGNVNGTRRRFKIGDEFQTSVEGRYPHLIVTRIDSNGKVVEAIDSEDGRVVMKGGHVLMGEELHNQPKRLSNEIDQNGSPFMVASDGDLNFGEITADKNLTPAPIRLSLGNEENGFIHIEKRHGDQIRKNGFKDVFEFIEHVLKNYTRIKEGESYDNENGGKNQTYYIQLTDKHNNTIFIQLSRDDSYWNINSAGVFSKRYGKNKKNIWPASEVQNSGSATTSDASQSEPTAEIGSTSNGTASNVSKGKGTQSSETSKGKSEENVADTQKIAVQGDVSVEVNTVATAIAAAEAATEANPTDAQKEAGNYRKGHVKVDGFDITIENAKGSTRSGKDADGKEWSVTMNNTYGYIRGTEGVDGDHIDIYLSDEPSNGNVFVIDQVKADGTFDEHKVMYGFASAEEARDNYLANYSEGWTGLGTISEVTKDEFKKWIESSHRKTKPFADYKNVKVEGAQNEAAESVETPAAEPTSLNLGGEEYSVGDIEDTVKEHVQRIIEEGGFDAEIVGVKVIGSYMRGEQRADSDLDVLVEYKGKAKEDALFDALAEEGLDMNGVKVDINPITKGKSGTIDEFMKRNGGFSKTDGETSGTVAERKAIFDDMASIDMNTPVGERQYEVYQLGQKYAATFGDKYEAIASVDDKTPLKSVTHILPFLDGITDYFAKEKEHEAEYKARSEEGRTEDNKPSGASPEFSRTSGENNLVAVHNISAESLLKSMDLGGFAMPSIAITDVDLGFDQFADISLIFSKETIDPSDRRNRIYDRDAWTPTFPDVQKKLSEKVLDAIYNKLRGLVPMEQRVGSLDVDESNMRDNLRRNNWDAVEAYAGNAVMKQAYLAEHGKKFKAPMVEKAYDRYGKSLLEQIIAIANETGVDLTNSSVYFEAESNPEYQAIIDRVKDIILADRLERNAERFAANPELEQKLADNYTMSFREYDNLVYAAWKMKRDMERNGGKIPQVVDEKAAKELLDKKVSTTNKKYREWVANIFDGIVEKEGIRNERDIFTPSGNRRSFEQTHDPLTLHNVVAAMMRESERGGNGFFNSNIFGASANEMRSISEVKRQSKRLQRLERAEQEALEQDVRDELADISSHVTSDVGGTLDFRQALIEAVGKTHDANGIYRELHKWYPKFTKEDANRVEDIVKRIGQMAVDYFEAKPRRAVDISEVKVAVVPKGTNKTLVEKLKQAGIKVVTYDKAVEGSRAAAVKKEAKKAQLLFQRTADENMENVTDAQKLATQAVMGVLGENAGLNVVIETQEAGQRAADAADGEMMADDTPVDPFYSNAAKAVEDIKQEKATGEQWLAMIKKNGGLKAEEDKWMGLSDWLAGKKSVTKQEVMQFIAENAVKVQDVNYSEETNEYSENDIAGSDEFTALVEELTEYDDDGEPYISRERFNEYADKDYTFTDAFSIDYWGETLDIDDADAAARYLHIGNDRPIEETRLNYTTEGLENQREIALVVPTIEPYNESDEIHFGDAGEGRAVAWLRFGDATTTREVTDAEREEALAAMPTADKWTKHDGSQFVSKRDIYTPTAERPHKNFIVHHEGKGFAVEINDRAEALFPTFEEAVSYFNERMMDAMPKKVKQKVLVIDEVQSKRHQDGRENGYTSKEVLDASNEYSRLQGEASRYSTSLLRKYADQIRAARENGEDVEPSQFYTEEEKGRIRELNEAMWAAQEKAASLQAEIGTVPDAPFQKNWHELAMKRALRYAAENGYDVVAWTTGAQQAERYDMMQYMDNMLIYPLGGGEYSVTGYRNNERVFSHDVASYEELQQLIGKDLTRKYEQEKEQLEDNDYVLIEGDDLSIGGEGMKGFYDQMLPRFMDKYGKKWGVKTHDVELDLPNSADRVMHAVDVTPEMRESVMKGQPMFQRKGNGNYRRAIPSVKDAITAIKRLFTQSKSRTGVLERQVIAGVDARQIADLQKDGVNIDNTWVHSIDDTQIGHAMDEHGNESIENAKGQIAITEADFENIPDILSNYDTVSKSSNKNKQGNEVIVYQKTYADGTTYYVEEIRNGRRSLAFETMYKKKGSSDGVSTKGSPSTSATASDSSLSGGKGTTNSGSIKKNTEFMRVFHGSAAAFDHFDSSHFMEGEGSMVYGAGHYVTNVEGTGKMYATIATEKKQRSQEPNVKWKGERIDFSSANPLRMAFDLVQDSRSIKEARERAERYIELAEAPEMKQRWKDALDILNQSTKADFKRLPVRGSRQLYEIEIPDDNGSNYLDWNSDVSEEQSDAIFEALKQKYMEMGHSEREFVKALLNGSTAPFGRYYRTMSQMLGGDKQVSDMLSSLGFTGVKVPTGNRRGGDGRGMNYVIFNDADLNISNRVEFMENGKGTVYGWSEGNTIHLTPEGINPNTPIHEYTHLWAKAVQQKAPELWANIKDLLRGTPEWNRVLEDPAYKNISGNEDAVASEVLSRISGRENARKMVAEAQKMIDEADGVFEKAEAHSLLHRMQTALKKFWQWVGKNLFDMKKFDSVEEITDRVLYDMVNKTDLQLSEHGDARVEMQVVTDPKVIERLEKSEKITGYRNVVLNPDGTFGSPMASGLRSKGKQKVATASFEMHKWEQSEENPDLADENGKINLVKPDGKTVDSVDYNPYIHNRPNMVNKQFKQAWERPDLVYIRTEIPLVDLESGYHADKAAKSVGVHNWPSKTSKQQLILSRYDKPVEIMPWEEVANDWEKEFKERGVEFDIIPPKLLPILAERGVEILPPHKGMGEACVKAYEAWKSQREHAGNGGKNSTDITSENFKNWFGDWEKDPEHASKVVDENGKPLVVYHGTGWNPNEEEAGNAVFRSGWFTSIKGRAEGFGEPVAVYLDIKNPIIINEEQGENGELIPDDFNINDKSTWGEHDGVISYIYYPEVPKISKFAEVQLKRKYPDNYEEKIAEVLANKPRGRQLFSVIPKDAIQIKSATNNNGEYSTTNPDIRYRQQEKFEDGQVLPIDYNWEQDGYTVEGLNDAFNDVGTLLERFREKHEDYVATLSEDGESIVVEPWSKYLKPKKARRRSGKPTKQEQKASDYVARKTRNVVEYVKGIADKLHLPKVEVLTSTEGLKGKKATSKGWFEPTTGRIVIVLPNHTSSADVMKTLLHEGVAHYGLRNMFGEDFDTFLDNVFQNATLDVRKKITALAQKNGWDFRTATEEYLAGLAEDIKFDDPSMNSWWNKMKEFFMDMLRKAGFVMNRPLDDNDLRYILIRSYSNLQNEGEHGILREAENVVLKQRFGIEDFAKEEGSDAEQVAEDDVLYRDGDDTDADNTEADASGTVELERPMTLQESIMQGLMKLAENHSANAQLKMDVLHAIGGELSKLRKAMSAQKAYDRSTVDNLVGLATLMIKNGYISGMSMREITRTLNIIKNANGKKDISKDARKIVDMLVDNQVREAMNMLARVTNVSGSKVNASGVEVQGQLDVKGQMLQKAFKEAMKLDKEQIAQRMSDVSDRMESENRTIAENAAIEFDALNLALAYVMDITESKAEEARLKREIKDAKNEYNAGSMSKEQYEEYVASLEDAILSNKLERIEAAHALAARVGGVYRSSIEAAKEFRETERERVQNIHHMANSDMQGIPSDEHHKGGFKKAFWNSSIVRFFLKPLGTFEQMLRLLGKKSAEGKGYLYNHFMTKWTDATDSEWKNLKKATDELDAMASKVFGKDMRWSDLYEIEREHGTVTVSFWDGGDMKDHELTQGNLLYMYMVNKMTDGKMKLRRMGVTEEDMENISELLDPRFKVLADWLQDEFLVKKREDYNKVHERMFGAPMAAIENYFPLRILGDARVQEVDVNSANFEQELQSTLTGAIIKRQRNSTALDITHADAFSVVIEHLQEMEHWAAFAEMTRDLNTLLSYKRFKNQIKNMNTIYGAGDTFWKNFMVTGSMAVGKYHPKVDQDGLDKAVLNIGKGVTAAKISFRLFTAFKQLSSSPAFLADANMIELGKSFATPWKAWNWAMKELPTFQKRWQSRQAGDSRLMPTDMDWKLWNSNIVETLNRWGMSPNAFVDAITVAIGGRAIYNTKYKQYVGYGYSHEQADKKAKQDAAIAVNATQQSSESAFLSRMQVDRTALNVGLSLFRNASMGYQRQLVDGLRTLKRMMKPGYRSESIAFMEKQMVRDGLTEEEAAHAAKRVYNRSVVRNIAKVGVFGFVMQFAWNLMPYLLYLVAGSDDDEKKKLAEEAATHALLGGWMEGLSGGNIMSELGNMAVKGENIADYNFNLLPLMSDIQTTIKHFSSDPVAGANDVVNLLIQMGVGVNPQTLTDDVVAIYDACNGDPKTSKEAAILFARLTSMPQSQIEKVYMDELRMKGDEAKNLTAEQLAERYAKYKRGRGATLTDWMYTDEKKREVETKYIKQFEKKAYDLIKDTGDLELAKEKLSSKDYMRMVKDVYSATGDIELDEAYDAYDEKLKEIGKQVSNMNAEKNLDPISYAEHLNEIVSTPEYSQYRMLQSFQKTINTLIMMAAKATTDEERESYLSQVADLKRQVVMALDSMQGK